MVAPLKNNQPTLAETYKKPQKLTQSMLDDFIIEYIIGQLCPLRTVEEFTFRKLLKGK